ncbi:RagB/SusD family nutrient uptake outer membrane protein [Fulvivirgaceae bacterium PWU5]|uniref:RagB/SusD family nutrient uptake outer membrane protein n=1 Tax=Dawidia cretensis TaxID=2782350 RepID=A0AAP2DUM5_9BACT|nr:RagB/SusD family nutrient uptake outer membrane protein [Dawidia cretensis]MBT1707768.1 RagB/SusD family nutrient uptake outer membrane protein [Dawidia cretensis]
MNTKNIILGLMAILLMVSSCADFLDQDPQTALSREDAFTNIEKLDRVITGLYNRWRETRKDRGGFVFALGTDETQQGAYQVRTEAQQSSLDKYDATLVAGNSALTEQWNKRWPVIVDAATAIITLEGNTNGDAQREMLLGEASFIRAGVSFEITQYWGEIPVMDLEKAAEYGTTRQPLPVVYDFIVQDLERAIQYLPEDQEDKRRATKSAAQALLGKVYLYAPEASGVRDYTKARDQFATVINSGRFQLVPNVATLWDPNSPNPAESIFSFQFSNVWPDNNQCQWQTGSRAVASISDNAYFGGYDLLMPTAYCYSNVSEGGLWEEGDTRKDASIRYDFVYKGTTPEIAPGLGGDELDPHIKKYEDARLDGIGSFWYSGKNMYYLRYADILLCYAECLNELGSTGEAVTTVNTVRARAWGGSLPADKQWNAGMGQEEFRDNILDERMRELCFEGWRRMDLIRSSKFRELILTRNKWAAEKNTIQEYHRRYPIPLDEIKQNDEIDEEDQNEGYSNQ